MIWLFLTVYLTLMLLLFVFQRNIVFVPSSDNPFAKPHEPFKVFSYQTPMGLNLRGMYYPAEPSKPTIVYFHGNAGNVADRIYKTAHYTKFGYGIVLVGYRGYSGNPGMPTEEGFYEDARAAIKALEASGVPQQQMILYGESLGTGVATQMATEINAKALVLEAPFTSVVDVGASRYWFFPVRLLMKEKFDSVSKIGKLKLPILIIHGTNDGTVPYKFGLQLYEKITSPIKEFITLKGAGHADIYDFHAGESIYEFLAKL